METNPYRPPGADLEPAPEPVAGDARPQRVSFELTPVDIVEFNYRHARRRGGRSRVRAMWLLSVLLPAMGVWHAWDGGSWVWGLPAFVAAAVVLALSFWVRSKPFIRRQQRRIEKKRGGKSMVGSWSVGIAPDGLTVENPLYHGTYAWVNVESVVETDEHVALYLSPVSVIVVAKSAFATPAEQAAFAAAARAFVADDRARRGVQASSATPRRLFSPTKVLVLWLALFLLFWGIFKLTGR